MQYIIGLLGILFVGLKLTGFISWSWWLVTLPFWGGAAVALAIFSLIFLIAMFASAANKPRRPRW